MVKIIHKKLACVLMIYRYNFLNRTRDRGDSFGSGIRPTTLNTIQCVQRNFSRKMKKMYTVA